MKIKSKPATKTVATKTARKTTRKTTTKTATAETKAVKKQDAEKAVTLTCRFDAGCEVYAVGTFNNWQPWDKATKMADKKDEGVYSITLHLKPGRYEYKFFVVSNGKGDWTEDVENVDKVANAMGTFNSVLVVE